MNVKWVEMTVGWNEVGLNGMVQNDVMVMWYQTQHSFWDYARIHLKAHLSLRLIIQTNIFFKKVYIGF